MLFFRRRPKEYLIRRGIEFSLESPAFSNGQRIPQRYTCDGEDISPPLTWRGQPEGTRSYVLIVYDPDAPAGTFIHWVLYNIPGNRSGLPEAVPRGRGVVEGLGVQGVNDFGFIGYGGPCPPPGHGVHRYFFALHALDTGLDLGPGATAQKVLSRMEDHVIGYAVLMGTYSR